MRFCSIPWLSVLTSTIATFGLAGCGSQSEPTETIGKSNSDLGGARGPCARGCGVDLMSVPKTERAFPLFESLQVRPIAASSDQRYLFVTNTPDNRLEVFSPSRRGLERLGAVAVGLEPVAVAVRSDHEVWVVNHLSDSVSVVDVSDPTNPRVTRTLLVGDEPRDIVFAGVHHDLAFVTTAHRGQNSADDPDLFTPGVGRADVWVFDAKELGEAPGGVRLTKLTLFADTPRALAASADGKTVYAAAFLSGNQTTSVSDGPVHAVYPNGMPGPATTTASGQTIPAPATGLIVKWKQTADGTFHWLDAYGSVFDRFVTIRLPDQDVFAIDASQYPPVASTREPFSHVGTTLFNMAVNPKNGKVYVSNTDAHNDVRFEGHTPGFSSVAGNAVDSRITVLDPADATVTPINLNSQLDHSAGTGDPALARAFPLDLVVSKDGSELYVVLQGSSKLVVYPTSALEAGTAAATAGNEVTLSGGGPSGVVIDDRTRMAYVVTRFDNSIALVDLRRRVEVGHVPMFNPEPASLTRGRRFLYDAKLTSALGDQACASCHVGGDLDGLAWDLGNPGASPLPITQKYAQATDVFTMPPSSIIAFAGPAVAGLYQASLPLKGPMTTQSLRGLDNHGAMHWRGDRNGAIQQSGAPFLDATGQPVTSVQPNTGIFDEFKAFTSFNVAFPGLVGRSGQLSVDDMAAFGEFALQITYPPNPIRNLDNSLTPMQSAGRAFYFNSANDAELPVDRQHACGGCHVLDSKANIGQTAHPGFFGTDGRLSFDNESQLLKVPHLRNAYQKLGMYGASIDQVRALASIIPQLNPPINAVRGFGYNHDGVLGTIEQFLSQVAFVQTTAGSFANPGGIPFFADPANPFDPSKGLSQQGFSIRRAVASFLLAFDSNQPPIVGQQLTLTSDNAADNAERLALFEAQATVGNCDLVAHGNVRRTTHVPWLRRRARDTGFVFSNGSFVADESCIKPLSPEEFVALVTNDDDLTLTLTAVPIGSGFRLGIDRDADGYADGDELTFDSDPADPLSTP